MGALDRPSRWLGRARRAGAFAAPLVVASAALACGGGSATPAATARTPAVPQVDTGPRLPGPPGLDAVPLASFDGEEIEVGFARRPEGSLFVFAHEGRLWARAIKNGASKPEEAADLGAIEALGVAPSVVAHRDGYALVVDERIEQNHHLRVMRLGLDGAPLAEPLLLPPIAEPLSWAGLVLLEQGALLLHSVEDEGLSSVSVTPLDRGLSRTGGPSSRVFDRVGAWSATSTGGSLVVGAVRATADGDARHGTIELVELDAAAKAGPKLVLLDHATAEIDLQLAAVAGGVIVAWTDVSGSDPAVKVAVVHQGKLSVAPRYVAPPVGDQALIALTADPSGRGRRATIAFENVGQIHEGARVVRLATVGSDGALSPLQTVLAVESTTAPDLVADGDGFAALTLATAAATGGSAGGLWPSFVRFAPDLSVRSAEPIRFAGGAPPEGVAESVWSLSCAGGRCSALGAHRAPKTIVHAVELPVRESPWAPPAWRAEEELPPRIASMRVVTEGPRLVAARAARIPGDEARALVGWLSYHLEGSTPTEQAPRGEPPYAATLALQTVGDDGVASEPVVVSKRALSAGGLSTAVSPGTGRSEVVLAWVASDKGTPQVFVTKVDPDGKKLAQKKLTLVTRKAPKSKEPEGAQPHALVTGVAIAHAPIAPDARRPDATPGEGYVVTWIDTRDGNGELYAARINRDLEKTVVDKRLTQASGDAADPSLVVRGAEAFIAFADARDGKPSDIYLAHLDTATLREIDDDARVYASRGTSRSPRLHAVGDALLLAWIEDPPAGDTSGAVLKLGLVDDLGRLVGAPRTLPAPDGASATAFTIRCARATLDSCRGVMSFTAGGAPALGGFTLAADGSPSAVRRLGSLASAPFADPSLSFSDPDATSLFLVDELSAERGRLRRIGLGW